MKDCLCMIGKYGWTYVKYRFSSCCWISLEGSSNPKSASFSDGDIEGRRGQTRAFGNLLRTTVKYWILRNAKLKPTRYRLHSSGPTFLFFSASICRWPSRDIEFVRLHSCSVAQLHWGALPRYPSGELHCRCSNFSFLYYQGYQVAENSTWDLEFGTIWRYHDFHAEMQRKQILELETRLEVGDPRHPCAFVVSSCEKYCLRYLLILDCYSLVQVEAAAETEDDCSTWPQRDLASHLKD